MNRYRLCAPCLFGLEGLVADELKWMSFENIAAENGRVFFDADVKGLARANISLRCAERVMIAVARYHAETFTELFDGCRAAPWGELLPKDAAFPVSGHCVDSKLFSVPDCQSILKKSIVENMKEKYGVSWLDETGAVYSVRFQLYKDEAVVYIDTSGESLHKRGYRAISAEAPIRETLAAGIAMLSHYNGREELYDPFCGSGTLLIEAALSARRMPPGINRHFAAEQFAFCPARDWEEAREEALAGVRDTPLSVIGSDVNQSALDVAVDNARKAGLPDIRFRRADVKDFAAQSGVMLANPPYGERMLDVRGAEELYKVLGRQTAEKSDLKKYILSPSDNFERLFGKRADKKRKLYNGMIKTNLFMYFNQNEKRANDR